ncbi:MULTISPECIES: LpqB family beta-propeller domain-containing protein [Streptomyces]|uniref:Lipoprotein LpqB n=1 Tax=Streptomyces sudanensis TaxID=436397 RepID=A0ABY4TBH6_9ACTN|nr:MULTISPECIES: LpqB family beta-propeller domain-containing protein [Streptomyces]URN16317.1 LpqB family beta-propeller domain-containing protein [Streptomyces sudanensis]
MGTDRRRTPRRTTRGTALLGAAALLAGCASMPDSGDVSGVRTSRQGDSQVRVYPVPPRENAEPAEIVEGFLEAMTGDDPGFATARKYLTKQAARTWKPEERTTVLSTAPVPQRGGPARQEHAAPGTSQTLLYRLSGRTVATVDERHAYQPLGSVTYSEFIQLVQQRSADGKQKEWRIDVLPQGLLLSESDFQRNYRSVNKYYFASGRNWVVADPVYIRKRQDPVTGMDSLAQTVEALLEGPTSWLRPVVDTRFPDGTELKKDTTVLTTDDRNTLRVPLNDKANHVDHEQCRRMAAQVLFTVGDLASNRVRQVELQRADGRSLCTLHEDRKPDFMADPTPDLRETPYFVDAQGRLAQLLPGAKETVEPRPVRGPFGDGTAKVETAAIARDERHAAAVSENGRTLRVTSIQSDSGLPEPLVTSRGARPADRLSAPSWDGRKDLWVADRDPADPRLLLLRGGTGEPLTVTTPWLDEGVRIEELRLSEDGVRIALRLTEKGRTTLQIGRVQRQTAGGRQKVSVVDLQAVAPRMESVTSVSWAGPSRLVVLAKQAGGVQQVRYLQTDGSASAALIPGLNQVKAVAAASDERAPLVASADDGLVRLRSGVNWQPMVEKGTAPVYPG